MEFLTTSFRAPSGIEYTIREQNGQDEEILTNVGETNKGMSMINFLQAIIMSTSKKPGKLTVAEVMNIPLLDRQVILLKSRIFSIGEDMEFKYRWPKEGDMDRYEEFEYVQDLNEYLFDSYDPEVYKADPESIDIQLANKPKVIPIYPLGDKHLLEFTLKSGKAIRFHLSDGHTEKYLFRVREADQTRNTDLIARGLELMVDGNWERVSNFSLFSLKDMREIRKLVNSYDPINNVTTTIENPITGVTQEISIFMIPDFFFPEEGV